MSLVPKAKVDELALVLGNHNPDIICITETWLKNKIPDDVVQIHNYTLLRRDRKEREHGGVCLYIKNSHSISVLDVPNEHECEVDPVGASQEDMLNSLLECLPRGYAKLVIGVLYHPPGANKSLMLEHLQSSLKIMETKYPNCGILLTGDFNKLPTQQLTRHFHPKQIVDFPTRG
jgi:exonuclease III